MTRDDFADFCLELLAPLGAVRAQRMFGGHGLYLDELFFGLIAAGRLYLKTDTATRAQFAGAGCAPFVYAGKGKPVTMSYWCVPAEALESPAKMQPWARLALRGGARRKAGAAPAAAQAFRPQFTPMTAQAAPAFVKFDSCHDCRSHR
jgi:DNA transformation protein